MPTTMPTRMLGTMPTSMPMSPSSGTSAAESFLAYLDGSDATRELAGSLAEVVWARRRGAARRRAAQCASGRPT